MVISMERWNGEVAIITGASAGIGAALAQKLVEAGLQVVGLARRKERVEELAKKLEGKNGKLYPLYADVSKEDDILAAFKWVRENLGPVHILINNAGFRRNTNLIEGDTKMWKDIFDTNVIGLCICTREAVKDMRANKVDGHIMHINSVVGHKVIYFPQSSVYPASKYAVTALTETLRQELNSVGSKIKITSVSPGAVDTEFREAAGVLQNKDQAQLFKKIPYLQSEDVVDAILYALGTPPHVQVVGLARRKEKVEELAKKLKGKSGKLHPLYADVSKEEDILAVFKWLKENLGPIHILINNAGFRRNTNLIEGDAKLWKEIFDTNVMGLCICTREAVKDMRANNVDGHIIHINSVAGHKVTYFPQSSVYPASKYAVTALTETLRRELNSIGSKIKITSVSPGAVETEFRQAAGLLQHEDQVELFKRMAYLESEDVADAVLYALATPPHVQIHELIIKPVGELF